MMSNQSCMNHQFAMADAVHLSRKEEMMIDWKNIRLDLYGDIQIHPSGSVLLCNSATPHCPWSRVEEAKLQLSSGDHYRLDGKQNHEAVHYRMLHPDWPTFKEWLRVFFNDLDAHELDAKKYSVYQAITGILLEEGSARQVQGDVWFEAMEAAPHSFSERTFLELWEEIDCHGFPSDQEQEDD